jgi:acetyl-CoA carboxylase biotin carboxyl carrier protein
MTIEEIKELINLANESGIAELEVQRGDYRVRIRRMSALTQEFLLPSTAPGTMLSPSATAQPGTVPSSSGRQNALDSTGSSAKPQTLDEGHELVKSPIVGTYYDAGAPGAPPFVRVGDQVEPGQVLCIIESMKLMNEIESEVAGTIVAKLCENGRPVEYGEALFAVRPR